MERVLSAEECSGEKRCSGAEREQAESGGAADPRTRRPAVARAPNSPRERPGVGPARTRTVPRLSLFRRRASSARASSLPRLPPRRPRLPPAACQPQRSRRRRLQNEQGPSIAPSPRPLAAPVQRRIACRSSLSPLPSPRLTRENPGRLIQPSRIAVVLDPNFFLVPPRVAFGATPAQASTPSLSL